MNGKRCKRLGWVYVPYSKATITLYWLSAFEIVKVFPDHALNNKNFRQQQKFRST